MPTKQLKPLILIAAGIILLAIVLTAISAINLNSNSSQFLLSIDKESIDEISYTREGSVISLKESSNVWKVQDFSADNTTIENFLTNLTKAKITSTASTNKSNHSIFQVDDSTGKQLKIFSKGQEILSIIVGKAETSSTTFFRYPNQDEVFVLDQSLNVFTNYGVNDLRDRAITAFDIVQVTSIRTSQLELIKTDDTWKNVNDSNMELDQTKATEFVQSLISLKALGIADEEKSNVAKGLTASNSIEIVTNETNKFIFNTYKSGDDYFVTKQGDNTVFTISSVQFTDLEKKVSDLVKINAQ